MTPLNIDTLIEYSGTPDSYLGCDEKGVFYVSEAKISVEEARLRDVALETLFGTYGDRLLNPKPLEMLFSDEQLPEINQLQLFGIVRRLHHTCPQVKAVTALWGKIIGQIPGSRATFDRRFNLDPGRDPQETKKIIVDGTKFYVQNAHVLFQNPVFETMINSELTEKDGPIILRDMPASVFDAFLHYLADNVLPLPNSAVYPELFGFASFVMDKELKTEMLKGLTIQNVIKMAMKVDVDKSILDFIVENFDKCTAEIEHLPLHWLEKFLEHDLLGTTEMELLRLLKIWCKHNDVRPIGEGYNLLAKLRLDPKEQRYAFDLFELTSEEKLSYLDGPANTKPARTAPNFTLERISASTVKITWVIDNAYSKIHRIMNNNLKLYSPDFLASGHRFYLSVNKNSKKCEVFRGLYIASNIGNSEAVKAKFSSSVIKTDKSKALSDDAANSKFTPKDKSWGYNYKKGKYLEVINKDNDTLTLEFFIQTVVIPR